MGLFAGRLGRERVFFIIPRGVSRLHLPSDLLGLVAEEYDGDRSDKNFRAALGPACSRINQLIKERSRNEKTLLDEVIDARMFAEFTTTLDELIRKSTYIEVGFIHSRRWRENHDAALNERVAKKNSSLKIYLPDLSKKAFIGILASRFDDEKVIPSLIADAYTYFTSLMSRAKGSVTVSLYDKWLGYSFYMFDDSVIFSIYPNSTKRKAVPAIHATLGGKIEAFIQSDLTDMRDECRKECRRATSDRLKEIADEWSKN